MERALAVAAFGLVAAAAVLACSSTCTSDCQSQYEKCIDHAPPGAAKSDCQTQYDVCTQQCTSQR
jgi:hypothetical protein